MAHVRSTGAVQAQSVLAKDLGAVVRRQRENHGWSQEALAERANLNRSYIGELERGEAIASIVTLEKLAHAFGLSASHLVEQAERLAHSQVVTGIELTSIAC
jgi:transcriptional regulator with XRE-family HTH domain